MPLPSKPTQDAIRPKNLRFVLATISKSTLTATQKDLLRLIARGQFTEFRFGVGTIAKKLKVSERSAQRAIRALEGFGILTLVAKERLGKMPRVYVVGNIAQSLCGDKSGDKRGDIDVLGDIVTAECHRITLSQRGIAKDAQQPPAKGSSSGGNVFLLVGRAA